MHSDVGRKKDDLFLRRLARSLIVGRHDAVRNRVGPAGEAGGEAREGVVLRVGVSWRRSRRKVKSVVDVAEADMENLRFKSSVVSHQ